MPEINKKSFVLYNDSYDAIRNLLTEDKAALLDAIFKYNIGEPLPDMNYTVQAVFIFFKNYFDRDIEKYANVCERNRENIKKRYATKSTTGKSGIPNLPEATKSTDNENEIDTEIDTEIDISKEKYKKESLSVSEVKKCFDRFYATYPKKKSPKQAQASFTKVIKEQKYKTTEELNAFTDKLINAINLQISEHKNKRPGEDYTFWKYPSSWLNAGAWNDDVDLTMPVQLIKQQYPKTAAQHNANYVDMLKDAHRRGVVKQK